MGDLNSSLVQGVNARGYRRGTLSTDSWDQYVIPVKDRIISFAGRASTFKTQGNASATTQNLFAIHNATGSTVNVCVNRLTVDLLSTAAAGKAPSVVVPVVRVRRFTALPTGGSALTKVNLTDSAQTSSSSVTVWGSTASDGGALTTLAVTGLGILAQKFAPRLLVVGTSASTFYEPVDTLPFFYGEPDVILKPLEGIVVTLEGQVVTTGNPATDFWTVDCDWEEFTRP